MVFPPTLAHLPVECLVAASAVEFPVEPGLTVPWTGPAETLMVPDTSTSVSDWVSVKVLVTARVLGLELARPRLFQAVSPDPK